MVENFLYQNLTPRQFITNALEFILLSEVFYGFEQNEIGSKSDYSPCMYLHIVATTTLTNRAKARLIEHSSLNRLSMM